MRTLGNILWFVLGGVIMGLGWWLAGAIAFISIIGIPWARSCFVIGRFSFFPFGQEAIDREELTQDRKSTRLNSSHVKISYAVFCLKKKNRNRHIRRAPGRADWL